MPFVRGSLCLDILLTYRGKLHVVVEGLKMSLLWYLLDARGTAATGRMINWLLNKLERLCPSHISRVQVAEASDLQKLSSLLEITWCTP